ncbi:prolyl oligopeptidase family serine peptidase [Streptomyces sp. NBC_01190]|uniref:S9 family peptidase n=1 Tax=Streptomyces sp. NBC_01190 TaxID=2903767 RepID=UPI00386D92D1|nr:prolyl oligopeptidase family serine peptidase [Streptomyces sp. NBC_01190]
MTGFPTDRTDRTDRGTAPVHGAAAHASAPVDGAVPVAAAARASTAPGPSARPVTRTAPSGSAVVRTAFRFSAGGTSAACQAADERHRWTTELWELGAAGPRRVLCHDHPGDAAFSSALPLGGGRLLRSRHGRDGQTLELLAPDGRVTCSFLGPGRPLRLLATPDEDRWLGLALRTERDLTCTVLGVAANGAPPVPVPLVRVPGRLSGGAVCGGLLLFTRVLDGRTAPALVDPAAGTVRDLPLPGVAAGTDVRVLAAGGPSALLAVADTGGGRDAATGAHDGTAGAGAGTHRGPAAPAPRGAGGGRATETPRHRLALAALDGSAEVRLLAPDSPLAATGGTVHPVALDPAGRTAAVVSVRGARSALVLHDWTTGRVREVDTPDGVATPVAAWPARGLWLPLSTARHPAEPYWLPAGAAAVRPGASPPRPPRTQPARLESLPGAAGPVEAVLYGPDWRTAPGVVLALHGGPNNRWDLDYDPFFQALAGAGLSVVAPNQRGSTGYGARHTLAIVGDWGGADLDDVTAVAAHLRAGRGPALPAPSLYGISYGAHLALLAAAAEGARWSACAAVAPFLSGARLYEDGGAGVRALVQRLGGRPERRGDAAADGPGTAARPPRDLERLAERIRLPLLLVHGVYDETVPVGHSRALAARLEAVDPGRTDVRYLELSDRGHHPLGLSAADPVTAEVVRFLLASGHGDCGRRGRDRTAAGPAPAPRTTAATSFAARADDGPP